MRKKFLLGATALAAVAVVQWLPTTAQAADAVPSECVTSPAPTGPQGEQGPQGPQGPPGPQGPDGQELGGPSRAVHAVVEVVLPLCEQVEGICVVKLPGEQGPIGEVGDAGEPGPIGEPGSNGQINGPGRVTHSVRGADPCAGVNQLCEITLVGAVGPQGPKGEQGVPGPQGPSGNDAPFLTGPSRVVHAPQILLEVTVDIPTACTEYLESLVPVPTTTGVGSGGGGLPATGSSSIGIALAAVALVALGGAVLVLRRRTVV